jgi:hypothetical protein
MSEAPWKVLFANSRVSFLEFMRKLQGMPRIKRKKRAIRHYIIRQTRHYRQEHTLIALCETLLLLRCLDDIKLGSARREVERKVLRSFCFIVMRRCTPEDVELIEYLYDTQVHSMSMAYDILLLRIYDFVLHYPKEVKGKIRSKSLTVYESSVLEEIRAGRASNLLEQYPLGCLLDYVPLRH